MVLADTMNIVHAILAVPAALPSGTHEGEKLTPEWDCAKVIVAKPPAEIIPVIPTLIIMPLASLEYPGNALLYAGLAKAVVASLVLLSPKPCVAAYAVPVLSNCNALTHDEPL